MAGEIAGRPVVEIEKIIARPDLPEITSAALNALLSGLKCREKEK
jgi:hypothetical protein